MMPRTFGLISTLVLGLLAGPLPAEAQQPTKIPQIGYLGMTSLSKNAARTEAFRQGLRELGYVEGKNIIIEWRSAEGKRDRLPALAAALVGLNVDIIVSAGGSVTRPLKEATRTIPIVMAQDNDPVASGHVASLARPGGNITGLSTVAPELSGKRLEILKEIVPRLARVAVLGNSNEPANSKRLREIELAAGALKLKPQHLDVLDPKDIESAFSAATKASADAVLVLGSPVLYSHQKQLIELAVKSRLPAMYPWSEIVGEGGLMTYSAIRTDLFRRAASYVDKILRGAKPAELPVEQPTKFELLINLKTAKQIGLTIPPSILYRADKVIK